MKNKVFEVRATEIEEELATLQSVLKKAKGTGARKAVLSKIRALRRELGRLEDIDDLREQIKGCRSCGLNRTRNRVVPWSGPIAGKADLILVGEAPGADEDAKGVPFVGRSGRLLDALLSRAGTNRERCFVANTLCCRPPDNRDPKPRELAACRPNFEAQLNISGGWVGVTLGAYALANVMGKPRESIRMGEYLDTPVWVDGRIWIPTYHPAYALRNRSEQEVIVNSLRFALALRWGQKRLPIPPHDQIDIDGKPGVNYIPLLEKRGWVLVFSHTLNCQIVIVNGDAVKLPPNLRGLPRYTFDELMYVGIAGKSKDPTWTKTALQTLHMVKSEFNGEVVAG